MKPILKRGILLAALAAAAAVPRPHALEGQEATLDRISALAARGDVAEARELLSGWWEAERPQASRGELQKGIWLRALLTVDPSLAELDFQRLVLEYPGGAYSAAALVRLGYASQARGDLVMAARYFERAARDYPGSDGAAEARGWLERWQIQVGEAQARQRAAMAATAGGAEAAAPAAATPAAPPSTGDYAVQLGAFRSMDRVRIVEERAREAGLEPRVVRVVGSDLIRIRVGRWETSREATDEMRRIRAMGLEAAVVKNAGEERPVG